MGNDPILAWHFTGDTLRDGRPVPSPGEILTHDDGDVIMSVAGLHASREPLDALRYAPGSMVHRVEVWGDVEEHPNKLVGRHRRILWSADATDPLRAFSRWCALSVIDVWDAPDVVRRFLETGDEALRDDAEAAAFSAAEAAALSSAEDDVEDDVETAAEAAALSTAWAAAKVDAEAASRAATMATAWVSAKVATKVATWGATWVAAWVAARVAQNTKLNEMLNELEPVVTRRGADDE